MISFSFLFYNKLIQKHTIKISQHHFKDNNPPYAKSTKWPPLAYYAKLTAISLLWAKRFANVDFLHVIIPEHTMKLQLTS